MKSLHNTLAAACLLFGDSVIADDYPLQPVPIKNVKIDGAFWGPRITMNTDTTVSHNVEFLEKTGRLAVFDRAAGVEKGDSDESKMAVDSDVFKIIEGAAYAYQQQPDAIDFADLQRQVSRVIAAQEKDGFLCPRITLTQPESRWEDMRHSHVLYSAGHLFEAGVAWKEATGRDELLQTSVRYADLIDGHFGPGKLHDVPGHQEIELALVRLYRATGEKRYLELCKFFLDQRGHIHGGTERQPGEKSRLADYNQDRVPLTEEVHAVGHAVRAGYTYAAMADIAALTNDAAYREALDRIWKDVVDGKLYVTGASATAQYWDEGFGDPYVLPNDTAYAETCGTIATVMWAHRMALLHEDAQYVDVLERALYNGVLSGVSLEGDKFFYKNPLASRGEVRRYESWNPACCQSNLVRMFPQVGSMAYATRDDAVFVNLFVSGEVAVELKGGAVRLRQETEYPHEGAVRIVVEESIDTPVTIAVRIPGWAREEPVPSGLYRFAEPSGQKVTLKVADEARAVDSLQNGYAVIKRTWKGGDVIELDLPMPARRVLADKKVEANIGRVSLQRGPLVYCVEAIDHGGLRTDALILSDDAPLHVERRPDFLGDVVVITADAEVAEPRGWGEPATLDPQAITAIPYYAWANRGDGYMDVWLARELSAAKPLLVSAAVDATVTASVERSPKQLAALTDGRSGPSSDFRPTPRFSWPAGAEGGQWVQFTWEEPRELSRTAVYWAVDRRAQVYWGKRIRGEDLVMPKTWEVEYLDGTEWRPVEAEGPFTLRVDQFNEVRFRPVTTSAVRLVIDPATSPSAIHEWVID